MNIEAKVNAIINYILAETEAEKEKAVCNLRNAKTNAKDVEEEIASILFEIGVPENIKGYRYSAYAIKAAVENPNIIDAVTCELYPAVAKKFDTTASRAERTIRYGIERALDRCDFDVMEKYFGFTISASKGKPTNSEFIARIANIVKRRVANG